MRNEKYDRLATICARPSRICELFRSQFESCLRRESTAPLAWSIPAAMFVSNTSDKLASTRFKGGSLGGVDKLVRGEPSKCRSDT